MNWETIEGVNGLLCGVDEVGRGCLAGPVVSCAVIMPDGLRIDGVKDSKKLTPKRREILAPLIREQATAIGFGVVTPEIIDKIGIRNAVLETMRLAVEELTAKGFAPDHIAVDYERVPIGIPQTSVLHGDDRIYEIACASILAKVYRDHMTAQWDEQYPGYQFSQHKGYGTKLHIKAIQQLGLCEIHRRSFCRKWDGSVE